MTTTERRTSVQAPTPFRYTFASNGGVVHSATYYNYGGIPEYSRESHDDWLARHMEQMIPPIARSALLRIEEQDVNGEWHDVGTR